MRPIPEHVSAGDPFWEIAFLDLAHGLVMAGAKAKIISRFTDFPLSRIRKIYLALRGTDPPPGPAMSGNVRNFVMRRKRVTAAWSIQCAIFLGCYERVGKITDTPVHRGWQLLAAFSVYLSLTEKLHQTNSIKRLDINQGYALLSLCGFMAQQGRAEMRLKECRSCLIRYPVATIETTQKQRCPVCAMNANVARLSRQAPRAGRGRQGPKAENPAKTQPIPPSGGGD